jgi:glycosyltransferase involved in cell wall biosynthesis
MKIAFVTIYDLRDIRRGSGTFYSLAKEMERQGHVIHYVGPFEAIGFPVLTRALKRLAVASGKRYSSWQDPFIGRRLGRAVEQKLTGLDFDILLTRDYTITAYTRTTKPLVLYSDSVFPLDYAANTHPMLVNLSPVSVFWCHRIVRHALQRVSLALFAPRWAYEEALKYGVISEDRMGVVPSGANISAPARETVLARRFQKNTDVRSVRLLFVGKRWAGKGGDIAVDTVMELNRRGIKATLEAVGSKPDRAVDETVVKLHGLLDKSVPAQREKLAALYAASDALILPSLGEGFVNSALEAAAYGLPVLSYQVQGVVDAVRNGETGVLLPRGAPGSAFANAVEQWFRHPATYDVMSRQARDYFDTTVNWQRAAEQIIDEIQHRLPGLSCLPPASIQSVCQQAF